MNGRASLRRNVAAVRISRFGLHGSTRMVRPVCPMRVVRVMRVVRLMYRGFAPKRHHGAHIDVSGCESPVLNRTIDTDTNRTARTTDSTHLGRLHLEYRA